MINGIHYVTLATDASRSVSRIGMAYYIRDDDGITKEAWFLDGSYNATQAEWLALERALEVLSKKKYWANTKLIFYGDNSTMIQLVENAFRSNKAKKNWQVKQDWVNNILSQFSSVEARHVPSHTNRRDAARYALNRWCDFNARSMVRYGKMHIDNRYVR